MISKIIDFLATNVNTKLDFFGDFRYLYRFTIPLYTCEPVIMPLSSRGSLILLPKKNFLSEASAKQYSCTEIADEVYGFLKY